MKSFALQNFFAIVLMLVFGVPIVGQVATASPDSLASGDWRSFFPQLSGCERSTAGISDDHNGVISQAVQYVRPRVIVGEFDLSPFWDLEGPPSVRNGECGNARVEMTVPFTPVQPVLSKKELREQKRLLRREKEARKKLDKIIGLNRGFFPDAPPPRAFILKGGREALQLFDAGCDYIPCESDYFTTISVKFAADKKFTMRVLGNIDKAKDIIESIDFEKLNAAMNIYADSHKKTVTK